MYAGAFFLFMSSQNECTWKLTTLKKQQKTQPSQKTGKTLTSEDTQSKTTMTDPQLDIPSFWIMEKYKNYTPKVQTSWNKNDLRFQVIEQGYIEFNSQEQAKEYLKKIKEGELSIGEIEDEFKVEIQEYQFKAAYPAEDIGLQD